MSKWNLETLRSLLEIAYHRDYRYTEGQRGTLLDLECAVMEPRIEAEINGEPEVFVGGDWLRRFMTGSWRKTDGHYFYTVPRRERLVLLHRYLGEQGLLLPAMLSEHSGRIGPARRIRDERGYRLADQRILAGTFRGVFAGSVTTPEGISEAVMVICFVPGDDLFRIRVFRAWYRDGVDASADDAGQHFNAFNFTHCAVTDAFASFGTEDGRIFCRDDGAGDLVADDYTFISKGRRVSQFTLAGAEETNPAIRLRLCRRPAQIIRMLNVIRAIDAAMNRPIAAE